MMIFYGEVVVSKPTPSTPFNYDWLECPEEMKELRKNGMTEQAIRTLLEYGYFEGENKSPTWEDLKGKMPETQIRIFLKTIHEEVNENENDDNTEFDNYCKARLNHPVSSPTHCPALRASGT